MSAMSQARITDLYAREAYATPLSAADDGIYHPAKYSHGADSLYADSLYQGAQTNRGPTTLQPAPLVANAIVAGMPQSPVWHTTRLAETGIPISTEKLALATDIFEGSSTSLPNRTPSATTFDFPVTSATSVVNNQPQREEPAPKESRVYHLSIVFLVASLIILMIAGWFKRQAERKKPILATYQQLTVPPTVPPTVQKERFAAALSQSKGLVTGFLTMSAAAISAILASFSSAKSNSETCLKDVATTLDTRRSLMERFLEQKIRIFKCAVIKISNFRRWISDPLGRQRADDKACVEKDEVMTATSASLHEESRGSPRDSSDEQTRSEISYTLASKIRPSPPAIIVERSRRTNENGLKDNVPRGPISVDTVCLEEVCAASESSDTLRGSEAESLQTTNECHGSGQSPSVGLLRLNVYRIEMEFIPRRDTHLGVSQGDEVVLTGVFDDGWTLCELLRTKKQGLVPRACLSVWPSRPNNTPPSMTSVQLVPPTANSHTNSRPTTPVSPISPISSSSPGFPRFYSSSASTGGLI